MSETKPTTALTPAWTAGYLDARRGIDREMYPFEYADEPHRSAWLRGYDFGMQWQTQRQLPPMKAASDAIVRSLILTTLAIASAGLSIHQGLSGAACAVGVLFGTYIGMHMWKQAVEKAGTTDVDAVRKAMAGQSFKAPSGFTVKMDEENHHLHKPVFIGEVQSDGQFEIVWKTQGPVRAEPWSPYIKQ